MNLTELYAKVPVEKHSDIKVIGNVVIYDSGANILKAYLGPDGELIPATQATKQALAQL